MLKQNGELNIWIEQWPQGTVILWREDATTPYARVYSPIGPDRVDEVIELIKNIHSFRTNGNWKTTRELREHRIKAVCDLVRLGQVSKELNSVSLT